MKINLDFYKSKAEEEIEEKIIECSKKSKKEILQENDLAIIEDFSSVKNNILNWYNFKENSRILEINTNFGGITRLLSKNAKEVIITSEQKNIADVFEENYKEIDNIEMYVGNINDIKLEENSFDYIIIYNIEEIKYLKKYLKEDGKGFLICDNKFSISAFAGAKPKNGKIFETIMENDNTTFSKKQIEKELQKNGFMEYQFYYPLPNYRMPNVIFSDNYLPDENTTKLMYNINYRNGSAVGFDELKALKQVTKDGQFVNYANSYLVQINKSEIEQPQFISYNNTRKTNFRLITKIYDNYVEKVPCFKEAEEHIKNIEKNIIELQNLGFNIIDKVEGVNIKSKYVNGKTLDKTIADYILKDKQQEAFKIIENWYKYIEEKLVSDSPVEINAKINNLDKEKIKELKIIKYGYIDIVFENIFFDNNEFILFDQEWYIEGIPLEFILYRALNNLYVYNLEINRIIPREKMMEKFNLNKYEDIFIAIEKYLQDHIIDEKMDQVNKKSLKQLVDINMISIMKTKLNDYEEDSKKKEEYIKILENEVKKLNDLNKEQDIYIKTLEEKTSRKKMIGFWKGNK